MTSALLWFIFQFKVLIGLCSPVRTFECLPLCFSLNVRFFNQLLRPCSYYFRVSVSVHLYRSCYFHSESWATRINLELTISGVAWNMYLKHRDPTAKQGVPEIRWRKLMKFLIFGLICWPVLFFLLCRTFFLSFCATKVYCTTSSFQNKIESLMIFWIVQRVWIRLLLWASNYMQIKFVFQPLAVSFEYPWQIPIPWP